MSTVDTIDTAGTAVRTGTQIHLAYPTMRRAAEILGVNVSALSRRRPEAVGVGAQKRLAPRTVLELAVYYNRRDPLEVAGELEEVAEEQAPEAREAIEEEVAAFLREWREERASVPEGDEWLEQARSFLPDDLFRAVKEVYERGDRPRSVTGLPPR